MKIGTQKMYEHFSNSHSANINLPNEYLNPKLIFKFATIWIFIHKLLFLRPLEIGNKTNEIKSKLHLHNVWYNFIINKIVSIT